MGQIFISLIPWSLICHFFHSSIVLPNSQFTPDFCLPVSPYIISNQELILLLLCYSFYSCCHRLVRFYNLQCFSCNSPLTSSQVFSFSLWEFIVYIFTKLNILQHNSDCIASHFRHSNGSPLCLNKLSFNSYEANVFVKWIEKFHMLVLATTCYLLNKAQKRGLVLFHLCLKSRFPLDSVHGLFKCLNHNW